MPRYSAYGARDDRVQEDGDRGFVGFNNRLRPDQLKPGMLADSQNGRMGLNGQWEVRKGIDQILTPVTTTGALVLDFTLPTLGQIGDGTTAIIDDGAVEGLYGSCAFSDPNNNASQFIILATNTKAIAYNLQTLVSTDIAYPVGVTVSSEVDMIQAFNKVFIFRDGQTALEWDGNTSNDFTKVTSGDYTQPVQITASITTAGGICTVTASAHGLDTGDTVHVEDKGASNLEVGESYVITKVDANTFTIFVQHPNENNTPNVIFQERVSAGLGFTHMPAPPFAIYHQRRLVMPFKYTVNDDDDTFTANGRLDELIASDILDTDTYDQIYANFRFNAGTADFIVGLHSFSEDALVVFNRNSIHLVQNSQVLNNATARLLTDEIGCLARRSIEQIGNQILFLSDNGVYGISFLDEYNLRGTELPLSESIDATIQRINKAHQSKAVSVYFDNRYYLAVPLDNSQENNAIIIYNFLNQQWESIDTVSTEGFHITNMFVAGDGADKGVYVVSDLGGINRLESRVDGNDRITTVIGGALQTSQVPGSVKTRQFTFNNLDRKKWRSFEMHVESQPDLDSNFDIDGELQNLDKNIEIGTLRGFNGDAVLQAGSDVSIRGRLGNPRAYGIQLDINNIVGRPKLRAVSVDGIESFRAVDKAE
jgi:hypothetical protein